MGEFQENPFMKQGPVPGGLPQQKQINVNIKDLKDIVCDKCQHNLFQPAFLMKTISRLLTGEPKDKITVIQTFCCMNCGSVPKEVSGGLTDNSE